MTTVMGADARDPALDGARAIADAVLYEGYVLFPYRASALKNRYRWQWGVLVPAAQAEHGGAEATSATCEVPLRSPDDAVVRVTARFLHLRRRQVHDADGTPVHRLDDGGTLHVSWDEGLEHEVVTPPLRVADLRARAHVVSVELPGAVSTDDLPDGGRIERTTVPVTAELTVRAIPTGGEVVRVQAIVRNGTDWSRPRAPRDEVLLRSMVGTHLLLSTDGGSFGSVIDPPDWAAEAASGCRSRGVFPVLVSTHEAPPAHPDVVLASPIILEDHPRVADESPGPSFDGLEIDELLALCVQGLTDDEKREARATDPRAADVVARSESLPPAALSRLHGTVRTSGPSGMRPEPAAQVDDELAAFLGVGEPAREAVDVDGRRVAVGDRVRLRPRRQADAHDLFVDGRVALVEKVVDTVDGPTMLAVTLLDDPAAELHRWYGRFQYFHLSEVEPTGGDDDDG